MGACPFTLPPWTTPSPAPSSWTPSCNSTGQSVRLLVAVWLAVCLACHLAHKCQSVLLPVRLSTCLCVRAYLFVCDVRRIFVGLCVRANSAVPANLNTQEYTASMGMVQCTMPCSYGVSVLTGVLA